jgi:hypothetical protein
MNADSIPVILGAAALSVGLGVVLSLLLHKGRRRAKRLGPAFELGTSRAAGFLDSAVEGLYRGHACRYLIHYASQYDRGGASLRISVIAPHRWTVAIANIGSRLLARLGLLKDFEIGDPELDQNLRFAAADESVLRSVFESESARDAMRLLAGSENFESCHVSPDRVDVRWSPRAPKLDEDPETLRERLEIVISLIVACGYPPRLAQ